MIAAIRFILVAIFCIAPLANANGAQAKQHFANREDVAQFVTEMSQQHGFNAAKLTALFAHTAALPSVVRLMQPPVVLQSNSWVAYRQRFVEPKRIAAGRKFMLRYEAALARAATNYGVPCEIIAAIIGGFGHAARGTDVGFWHRHHLMHQPLHGGVRLEASAYYRIGHHALM